MDVLRADTEYLMRGGSLLGLSFGSAVSLSGKLTKALLTDSCLLMPAVYGDVTNPVYANCTVFQNGVFHNSFTSAIVRFNDVSQLIQNTIPLNNDNLTTIIANTNLATHLESIRALENPYLRKIVRAISATLERDCTTMAASSISVVTIFSVLFVVFFAVFVVLVYADRTTTGPTG